MSKTGRNRKVQHHGDAEWVTERANTRYFGLTSAHGPKVTIPRDALLPGMVVSARILSDDGSERKLRPVVVEAVLHDEVIVHAVTSANNRLDHPAMELEDWQEANLSRPSAVRLTHVTVDRKHDITSIIGTLSKNDKESLTDRLIARGSTTSDE